MVGEVSRAQGVDDRDPVDAAEDGTRRLARQSGSVVAVTGAVDFVTDGTRSVRITGGSPWMPLNTALGCSLTCLCGAYAAVAGKHANEGAAGSGSFAPRFLDALHAVTPEMLDVEASVHAVGVVPA